MDTRKSRNFLPLGLALIMAACSTPSFRADVTRFHMSAVTEHIGKSVTIRPAEGMAENLEFGTYAAIVGEKLGEIGFKPAGDRPADIVATLDYLITPIATAERSGARIGIGAGSFGRRSAISGGVNFPVGESRKDTAYSRRLSLVLTEQKSGTRIWEGRAVSDGTTADPNLVVPLLADALLDGFPGLSGQTVTVRIDRDR